MIVLGIILLLIGWLIGIHLLITIGIIAILIGLVLLVVGQFHPIAGRKYWY